jgi:predicted Zn-dependent protease
LIGMQLAARAGYNPVGQATHERRMEAWVRERKRKRATDKLRGLSVEDLLFTLSQGCLKELSSTHPQRSKRAMKVRTMSYMFVTPN